MAVSSRAGPGEGVVRPNDIKIENVYEYGDEMLFIFWSGNGYDESNCWISAHDQNVCHLAYWE